MQVQESIRCCGCGALLFKAAPAAISGVIEIKCRRCGVFNSLRPPSPLPTADRAAERKRPCGSTYRPPPRNR
ncbi:MAG: Com family DNA-binding transcriptional regulator [Caulobacter sp.]|nr:Com family DNA-binding transcriptional regulator [Caulobacter sp.]